YLNTKWNGFQGLEGSCSDSTQLYEFGSSASSRETYSYSVEIEKWKYSNRMCLMIMKRLISEAFRGFILRVKGIDNIREYIMEIPAEARPYMPHERKLDSRTVNFILLAMLNALGAISFMIPLQDPFLKQEMRECLRKLNLGRKGT
ncbi:hypothetical protein CR513_11460, partial [Mucuna pruriens]